MYAYIIINRFTGCVRCSNTYKIICACIIIIIAVVVHTNTVRIWKSLIQENERTAVQYMFSIYVYI